MHAARFSRAVYTHKYMCFCMWLYVLSTISLNYYIHPSVHSRASYMVNVVDFTSFHFFSFHTQKNSEYFSLHFIFAATFFPRTIVPFCHSLHDVLSFAITFIVGCISIIFNLSINKVQTAHFINTERKKSRIRTTHHAQTSFISLSSSCCFLRFVFFFFNFGMSRW